MNQRRWDDSPSEVCTVPVAFPAAPVGRGARPGVAAGDGTETRGLALVFETGGDEVVLVGTDRCTALSRGPGGADLARRIDALASSWGRERASASTAQARFESLLLLGERLSRAETREDVRVAIESHVPVIVGAGAAILLEGADAEPDGGVRVVQIRPDDPAAAIPPAALNGLFARTGAALLVCAALGDGSLLAVAERRRQREWASEDLYRLRGVATPIAGALARLAGRASPRR